MKKIIKRIVVCVIIAAIIFVLVECFVIVGKVEKVEEQVFMITHKDADRTEVLSVPADCIKSSIKKGDIVVIIYTGGILESYPGKIGKIIYAFKI